MFVGGQPGPGLSADQALQQLWTVSLSCRAWSWAHRARATTRSGGRLEQGPERRLDDLGLMGTPGAQNTHRAGLNQGRLPVCELTCYFSKECMLSS